MAATRVQRRGGFTLVELLVTIGVIALLISLLAPAVVGARRSANALMCQANLRQWGIAARLYANQNNDFLPRRGQGVGATSLVTRPTDWFNALPPLMKLQSYSDLVASGNVPRPGAKSVWLCPSASDVQWPYYWSYGMNMGLSVWEGNQNNGQPDRIDSVGSESTMVLLTDAPGNYCSIFPSVTPGGYNPVARHSNNTVNICFLDGHVEPFPAAYVGVGTGLPVHPDIRWHPPGNTWNTAQ